MLRTNNPTLNVFAKAQTWDDFYGKGGAGAGTIARERPTTMTLQGAVNKTLILLALTVVSAIGGWAWFEPQMAAKQIDPIAMALLAAGGVFGMGVAVLLRFVPRLSPFLAPAYAVFKGVFVGMVSVMYSARYGNAIVLQAVLLTFGILAGLLIAYKSRLIKATENFKLGVSAATMGILFVVLASWVLQFVGITIPYIWDSGPIGLGVAAFIVVVAALNLVLDFDFIENGAERGLPRHMEWYAGFSLMVTLIWLYMSILRLLAMLADRR